MNNVFPSCIVGVTLCPDDTTDYYEVESSPLGFGGIPVEALDQKLVEYTVRYPDNESVGYEQGWGVYDHATRRIARTVVGASSAGEGTPVDWGSSSPKHIAATISGSTVANMARLALDLPPWMEPLIGGVGQSNNAWGGIYEFDENAIDVIDDHVWHYATSGDNTDADGARYWQVLDPNKQVNPLEYAGAGPRTGGARMVYNNSAWYRTTNPTYSFARRMAAIMGRRVRVINDAVLGIEIDDPDYGLQYDPSKASLLSTRFALDVTEAIAALPADQKLGDRKLNFLVYGQGGSDLIAERSSANFAYKLYQYLRDCQDPDKHNITDWCTTYLILGESKTLEAMNTKFNGWRMARDMVGNQAIFVPVDRDIYTADGIHLFGEGADRVGDEAANAVASPSKMLQQTQPGWRVQVNETPFSGLDTFGLVANGTGAINAANEIRLSASFDEIRISKLSAVFGLGGSIWDRGLKNFRQGDSFQLSVVDEINSANRRDVLILSDPVDDGNYATFQCDATATEGTPPVATDTVFLNSRQNMFDGEDISVATDMHTDFGRLQGGTESRANSLTPSNAYVLEDHSSYRNIYFDSNGRPYRHNQIPPAFWTLKTTNATATTAALYAVNTLRAELWDAEFVTMEILVRRNSDGVMSRGTATFTATNVGWGATATIANLVIDKSTGPNFDNLSLPADFVAISSLDFLGVGVWQARFKGVAATDLSWTVKTQISQALTTE